MRLPPLVCFLICLGAVPFLLCSLSVLFSHLYSASDYAEPAKSSEKSAFRALFSFPTPSALFPPSAIIGLTDDNSTFFLARPAGFGPPLPSSGLSGQLWIGSGFGDDNPRRQAGLGTSAEGELGCSDAPSWENSDHGHRDELLSESVDGTSEFAQGDLRGGPGTSQADESRDKQTERGDEGAGASSGHRRIAPPHDDGTDDYLRPPLRTDKSRPSQHADIQSLQESAEIAGKIVLLSRGGCSFLDKVKWVQRRGGLALIVGDHRRGGSLVVMYARGDTRNVSIPSLFTSHTTAHLLSSLVPPEGHSSEPAARDSMKSTKDPSPRSGAHREQKDRTGDDHPTFTPVPAKPQATSAGRSDSRASTTRGLNFVSGEADLGARSHFGWFRKIISLLGLEGSKASFIGVEADSRRPPSSGQLDWVLVDGVNGKDGSSTSKPPSRSATQSSSRLTAANAAADRSAGHSTESDLQGDDFIIGVQDWRDKDLLGPNSSKESSTSSEQRSHGSKATSEATHDKKKAATLNSDQATSGDAKTGNSGKRQSGGSFEGGVITPGSGEYSSPGKKKSSGSSSHAEDVRNGIAGSQELSKVHPSSEGHADGDKSGGARTDNRHDESAISEDDDGTVHEGLWVTLTPTTMSTSPFFDTLLVLVVSPLVTLTVVYGMLLVRSRIRRRRWRAPKSVVDRLPVRTYHTLSSSSSSSLESLRYSTPSSTSPACPLLYSEPVSTAPQRSRQRPVSNTFQDTGMARSWPPGAHDAPIMPGAEKVVAAADNRDRRYVGKQVECVICLEEYVDGVSRVMSLPCGHEFHAECITPWLTTRRRTCPICKGDVVRSLANRSLRPGTSYRDDPQEDAEQSLGIGDFIERSPFTSRVSDRPDSEEENVDLERADLGGPLAGTDAQRDQAR